MIRFLTHIPRTVAVGVITLYQVILSPDQGLPNRFGFTRGGVCLFYPTCSVYSKECIEKYGVVKGGARSLRRIIRCRPPQKPVIDKVP
ncbi:MAG: membrane protein insertion efficiency factor YidD [Minisyncoccota bacterium]